MMKHCLFQWTLCVLAGGVISSAAQEWSRFRGPNGSGVSDAKTIPAKWSETDINWKLKLPGGGHSSPLLWGRKIFLTSTDKQKGDVTVFRVDAGKGTIDWQKTLVLPPFRQHRYNSFASSSVGLDKDRVYVLRITPEAYTVNALDHDGEPLWDRDLGAFKSQHGGGTSPMIHDGKVILANEQMGQSFIVALNASTGKTVWQTPREGGRTAYGTPCLFTAPSGQTQLVLSSHASGVYALNPDTGKQIWNYPDAFDKRNVCSPVVVGGLVVSSCGSGGGGNYLVAVRPPSNAGDKATLAYEVRRSAPYVPTSVTHGDLLFLWSDNGIVSCVDGPSGKVKFSERVGGNYFSSPIRINDKLYNISTTGEVVVINAADTFKVVARNPLEELCHATPAVANGRLYVRTFEHLYSIGGPSS